MTATTLNGVVAPVLTPFDDTGQPDARRFLAHAQRLLTEGCTALAPFGTTGEATSLGIQERHALLDALERIAQSCMPVAQWFYRTAYSARHPP